MAAEGNNGPRVLILGGCGFIGRNLVKSLVDQGRASYIKVADKAIPGTSYLSPEHKAAFDAPIVKFVQSDLSKDPHVAKVFTEDVPFDYVFNLCGETRFGLAEDEYKVRTLETAKKCGQAARRMNVRKWVEVSTAQVYAADEKAHSEDSKLDPWTILAKYRLMAEQELKAIDGLPVVVLRPAIVYGPGDLTGFSPRITSAAVYQMNQKQMKILWDKDLKINAVHVDDVVEAMWLAASSFAPGSVYNLADSANLGQGQLNEWLGHIFKIQTGFLGSILSNLAKLNLEGVAEAANDEHVPGWTQLCQKHGVLNTPLTPYIDKELLKHNHLCVDGSKITKTSAFVYKHKISEEELRDQINRFIAQKLFPPVI